MNQIIPLPPYKSVAIALLFSVILGPVGVLYGSFWLGVIFVFVGFFVIASAYFFPIIILWLMACIVTVGMVERHNKKIMRLFLQVSR